VTVLLVVIPDRISAWIDKGEVIDRYYNPGDTFDEVHLLLINDDDPPRAALERMAGRAAVHTHHLPPPRQVVVRTLGLRPSLLRRWARRGIDLGREVRPDVVRCYGAGMNGFVGREISHALKVPLVVSLHVNPAEDLRSGPRPLRSLLAARFHEALERTVLRDADIVLPVYEPIAPYLEALGVRRYVVAYNMLNAENLVRKADYRLHEPVRVVSVGRQFTSKDPSNLVRAIAELPHVQLTLVGGGELHVALRALARELGVADRVVFESALPNDELCRRLPDFDVFAIHSQYWELSKAMLEALLTGLPLVVNRREGPPVPELSEDLCVYVDNSVAGYREALLHLIEQHEARAALGRHAAAVAWERWGPDRTEAAFAGIYRDLLAGARAGASAVDRGRRSHGR
jgi:glycosyltransferase involved in cell wall biosynthesis